MKTTRGNRLHIVFLGKMNTGKSSIINAMFKQDISIVSDFAGTTTDINQKAMELLPIGPVNIIDTAGIDDCGELGTKRVENTLKTLDRADIAVIVFDNNGINDKDMKLFQMLKERKIPVISVINKTDCAQIDSNSEKIIKENSNNVIKMSAKTDKDVAQKIKEGLIKAVGKKNLAQTPILADIVKSGESAVLVIPIDKEAPKGRIILPQVQVLRDMLDNKAISTVTTVETLKQAIENLKEPPKIVITDSQAFKEVAAIVPEQIWLTSFSIIFARLKGDLKTFVNGASALDKLNANDSILILESCSHHPVEDDIGRVKIPNLIRKYTGKNFIFEHYSGHDFPEEIDKYSLIIHCGACMTNRQEVLSRIQKTAEKNIPISNYGIIIAKCTGILERAIKPFINN